MHGGVNAACVAHLAFELAAQRDVVVPAYGQQLLDVVHLLARLHHRKGDGVEHARECLQARAAGTQSPRLLLMGSARV